MMSDERERSDSQTKLVFTGHSAKEFKRLSAFVLFFLTINQFDSK